MTPIQNTTIVFRCPSMLKDRIRSYADANGQDLSTFIRGACVEAMKKDISSGSSNAPSLLDFRPCQLRPLTKD
jgi:hypothetical protein